MSSILKQNTPLLIDSATGRAVGVKNADGSETLFGGGGGGKDVSAIVGLDITVGTWCYGAPAVAEQNPGMDISGNTFVTARDAVLGGSFATTSPGNSSLTRPIIANNKSLGGGGLALNRTTGAYVGPNFKNGVRENFAAGTSSLNTGVVTAP